MEQLEYCCQFVLLPACSLVGMVSSAAIVRVAAHPLMLPHLINRCILILALLDLHFLALALFDCLAATVAWPSEPTEPLVAVATRRLALPALARASLLAVAVISAERLCAVRRPRHLPAASSRRRFVYASLAAAVALSFLVYGSEVTTVSLPPSALGDPSAQNASVTAAHSAVAAMTFLVADAVMRGLPLLAILLLNACTVRVLRRSFRQRERLLAGLLGIQRALLRPATNAAAVRPPVVRRHRRTTCMLLYMSSLHLLLLTPAIFLSVAARLRAGAGDDESSRGLRSLALTLEAAACCINFPLYARQSEKFRAVLSEVCCCWPMGDRPRPMLTRAASGVQLRRC